MNVRPYHMQDKQACMNIFDSNCPKFFDVTERALFEKWLDHQGDNSIEYKSPTYKNTSFDAYFVAYNENEILGCAGYYISAEMPEARMAWGMVNAQHHRTGIGTILLQHRMNEIQYKWNDLAITLGTSQHTYTYYQRMGFHVLQVFQNGYGPNLHQYEMAFNSSRMFTLEDIQKAHSKVKSGADFPAYVNEIHAMGVMKYTTWVATGKTTYSGISNTRVETDDKYALKNIALALNLDTFRIQLRAHQDGQTDYPTFLTICAETGIEKWVIDIPKKTCTYYDLNNNEVLSEHIPI